MKRSSKIVTLGLLSFLATACNKNSQGGKDISFTLKASQGTPLAHVGNTVLTLEEASEDFLARQGTFRGAAHLNTERKRTEYVENAVMQRAMFLEGIEAGLINDPAVKRDIEKIVVQKLMRDKLTKAQEEYVATEAEMRDHYDKNPNLYNRQEGIKVAYFAIPYGENKQDAKKLADELQKDAKSNIKNANTKEFARLAVKHAQQVMNKMKVNLETNETGFLEKTDFENKFGKESFELVLKMENLGDVGPVLGTENSYFIVMKTGFRKAVNKAFEEAKPEIQKRIAYEQRGKAYEKFVADLRKKYNIKIESDRVAELGKNAAVATPANALANGGMPPKAPEQPNAAPGARAPAQPDQAAALPVPEAQH